MILEENGVSKHLLSLVRQENRNHPEISPPAGSVLKQNFLERVKEPKNVSPQKRALTAPIPPDQTCELCNKRRAPERHFLTVPVPKQFMRVCDREWIQLKKAVRQDPRIKIAVQDIFLRLHWNVLDSEK